MVTTSLWDLLKMKTLIIESDIPQARTAPESDKNVQLTCLCEFTKDIWPILGIIYLRSMNLSLFISSWILCKSDSSRAGKGIKGSSMMLLFYCFFYLLLPISAARSFVLTNYLRPPKDKSGSSRPFWSEDTRWVCVEYFCSSWDLLTPSKSMMLLSWES